MKSVQPRKQRKMLYQAPAHLRYKHFSALLSDSLRASHKVRSLPVRNGDSVKIMRGDRKGIEGKVTKVDRKAYKIFIEGVTREKVDGTTTQIPMDPSKVMITNLNLDDKWRRESLKVEIPAEKPEKPEEKPVEEEKKPKTVKKTRKKKTPSKPRAKKPKKTEEEKQEGS